MSDSDLPDRFGPAIRWVIVVIALFVFFLLGAEEFKDGKYGSGTAFAILFIVTFMVAVKWNQIARFVGRQKVTMFYVGLAVLCAIGLTIAIGRLVSRASETSQTTVIATSASDTGRIAWNFEEAARGLAYFLGLNRQNQDELRVTGFVGHGRNTSNDPVTEFKGYIRSDVTNEKWPIYLIAQDPNAGNNPFATNIPTLAEDTFGIPGSAEFNITTFNKAVVESGTDGMPASKFVRDFSSFTLALEYDGTTYQRHFTNKEIQGQFELFERQTDPSKNNAPRVVRRPTATPPIQPSLPFVPSPPPENKPKG